MPWRRDPPGIHGKAKTECRAASSIHRGMAILIADRMHPEKAFLLHTSTIPGMASTSLIRSMSWFPRVSARPLVILENDVFEDRPITLS